MSIRSEQIAIRVSPDERDEITARAQRANLSVTAYVVACCLGTIDNEPSAAAQRFEQLEGQVTGIDRRLSRLEELAGR